MSAFSSIIPILAVSLFGYIIARSQLLGDGAVDVISKFTFSLAVPALLFISMANSDVPKSLQWEYIAAFYGPVILLFIFTVLLGKWLFGYDHKTQSVYAVCTTYSNTTIIGIPLCIQLLGTQSLVPLFVLMYLQNICIFSFGIFTAERKDFRLTKTHHYFGSIFTQFLKSPIMLSVAAGLIFNQFSLSLPTSVEDSIKLFAQSGVPLALFVLGASLSQFKISQGLSSVTLAVVIKNVVFPCMVYFLAYRVFELESLWAATATLAATMPIGISGYVFSKKYQVWDQQAASSILLSTVCSVVTVSGLLYLFEIA